MGVDLSKIKPGDEVLVRAVVTRPIDSDQCVTCVVGVELEPDDKAVEWRFGKQDLASHTPKPLSVGDRVKIKDCGPEYAGTILGLHEGLAWLRFQRGGHTTAEVSGLERVDAD